MFYLVGDLHDAIHLLGPISIVSNGRSSDI